MKHWKIRNDPLSFIRGKICQLVNIKNSVEYNSESNRARIFKSANHVPEGWFKITGMITPELYNAKSYYQ